MFIGGGVLLVNNIFKKGGYVYSLQKVGTSEYKKIESAFRIKFPEGTAIKHADMVGGKDWVLYTQIVIPSDKKEKFLSNINFAYEVQTFDGILPKNKSLSWWDIDQERVEAILNEEAPGLTQLIFYKPTENNQTVFMFTDGGRTGFPKELLDLFNTK